MRLTPENHDRDVAGLTYVYPVVSRRARGVSVGINLNPNNACNWQCVYCQVPGLTLGKAPPVDLELLRSELGGMLEDLIDGDYMQRHVPEDSRRINDVAFSGNGEPTMSPQFAGAVEVVREVLDRFGPANRIKPILITNGSVMHKAEVQAALGRIAEAGGEIWFKLDSATDEGQRATNSNRAGVARALENLRIAAGICPTWIQTLVFARRGAAPSDGERRAYLEALAGLARDGTGVRGVHLYGLARRSFQPGGEELSALPEAWLEELAAEIRAGGLEVQVSL